MTLIEKVFNMSFTEDDCRKLSDLLNEAVKVYREQYSAHKGKIDSGDIYRNLEDARAYRQFFASAINRSYGGDDY